MAMETNWQIREHEFGRAFFGLTQRRPPLNGSSDDAAGNSSEQGPRPGDIIGASQEHPIAWLHQGMLSTPMLFAMLLVICNAATVEGIAV